MNSINSTHSAPILPPSMPSSSSSTEILNPEIDSKGIEANCSVLENDLAAEAGSIMLALGRISPSISTSTGGESLRKSQDQETGRDKEREKEKEKKRLPHEEKRNLEDFRGKIGWTQNSSDLRNDFSLSGGKGRGSISGFGGRGREGSISAGMGGRNSFIGSGSGVGNFVDPNRGSLGGNGYRNGLPASPIATTPTFNSSNSVENSRGGENRGSVGGNSRYNIESFLSALGISEYLNIFIEEGFLNLNSLMEIQEDDFELMRIKRGHRRIIQRSLASIRGIPPTVPLYQLNQFSSPNLSNQVRKRSREDDSPSPRLIPSQSQSGLRNFSPFAENGRDFEGYAIKGGERNDSLASEETDSELQKPPKRRYTPRSTTLLLPPSPPAPPSTYSHPHPSPHSLSFSHPSTHSHAHPYPHLQSYSHSHSQSQSQAEQNQIQIQNQNQPPTPWQIFQSSQMDLTGLPILEANQIIQERWFHLTEGERNSFGFINSSSGSNSNSGPGFSIPHAAAGHPSHAGPGGSFDKSEEIHSAGINANLNAGINGGAVGGGGGSGGGGGGRKSSELINREFTDLNFSTKVGLGKEDLKSILTARPPLVKWSAEESSLKGMYSRKKINLLLTPSTTSPPSSSTSMDAATIPLRDVGELGGRNGGGEVGDREVEVGGVGGGEGGAQEKESRANSEPFQENSLISQKEKDFLETSRKSLPSVGIMGGGILA